MRQPADIYPTRIVNYGMIASEYHEGMLLVFPLILANEGARNGLVSEIKIGFKSKDQEIKYMELDGKVRLKELDAEMARYIDWNKFEENGYVIIQPTYPIVVEPDSSADVYLIGRMASEENIIPIGTEAEVHFGRGKVNTVKFSFFMTEEDSKRDNYLVWLSTVPK
jgi:hypothetical protein